MRKLILLLSMSLCLILTAQAQTGSGILTGKLVDSASKQPMALATVSVFKASDTVLLTYRLSTTTGEFKITGLPLQTNLRVLVSYTGYHVYRQEFALSAGQNTKDMGTIELHPNSGQTLDEVLVIAERPPVVVKKDTIEFNASSFKTLPTALVEDLLKKLPGVQLDMDGNITVNGKKVNRLLVDGKDFFGGDPKMATRNLPANVIDKIQVLDDKDELEANPDKAKADVGQIINLKLKKAIKQGLFGKLYAGKGEGNLYEGGGIVNMFRDTLQVSVLGFGNNLNKAGFGFKDIQTLGGFDRSGINSISINGNGGLNVNGISFGGTGQGIQRSAGVGFNLNNEFKKGFTLNTQYFYGTTRNDIRDIENRQQFLSDTILNTRTNRDEVQFTNSHRIGMGLRWKIDSVNRLEFRPNLTIGENHGNRLTDIENTNNFTGRLSDSRNLQKTQGNDLGYNHSLSYFSSSRKKKGRNFNVFNFINFNNTNNEQFNTVQNTFYPTGSSTLDQLRDRESANFTVNTTLNYNEPLTKHLSLRVNYSMNYFTNEDDLATYNKNSSNGKYDQLNPTLTSKLFRKNMRNNASTGLNWRYKKLSVTASVNMQWLDISNDFKTLNTKVDQHFRYVLPSANINWREFNLSYNANITPPGIYDIQPVADNTNPLYINRGNPDLQPAISHGINLNFFKNVPQKQLFLSAYLGGNFSQNGVVRSRTVSANGVQTTMPVNADGIQSFYTNFYFNKQYKVNTNFQFNIGAGYNVNYSRNFMIINARKSYVKALDFSPYLRGGINWMDKIEVNLNYNRGFSNTYYESKEFTNLKVNRQSITSDLVVRLPKKLVWEVSLDSRYNSQAAPGIQKTVSLVNAGLTYLFLKDDKGMLKFSVFDLLNQNRSIFRFASENYITDRQTNIMQRYLMLTFTYNIRSFGAAGKGAGGKVGGRQSMFFF